MDSETEEAISELELKLYTYVKNSNKKSDELAEWMSTVEARIDVIEDALEQIRTLGRLRERKVGEKWLK